MTGSLLTNESAITASQALNVTQKKLDKAQKQLSTGERISEAADNPAYWSIAEQMDSDNGALSTIKDTLNVSSSMLDTFSAALQQTITVMNKIKDDVIAAQQPGTDKAKIQTDIAAQQAVLLNIASAATFNGQNWLSDAASTVKLLASYNSTLGASTLSVDTTNIQLIDGATAGGGTTGILAAAGAASGKSILKLDVTAVPTGKTLTDFLTDVESALQSVLTAASLVGATKTSVDTQLTFISNLSDSLTKGVGSLVDANMNDVSTKLTALQVQQQLGVQALSIANNNAQGVLKLFGG